MWLLTPIVHFFIFRIVDAVNLVDRWFAYSENLYKLVLVPGFENFRWGIGAWRGRRNFNYAYHHVPAYKKFVDANGGKAPIRLRNNLMPEMSKIPEMDKENYIKKYSIEERVVGGKLPRKGVMVDESSGSSGKPTSWVRGPAERSMTKQMLQLSYHRVMGGDDVFLINAFALGAWATGLNVTMSLTEISIIKSTGPDMDKIINTMLEFGPKYRYIIMGYPPFLKALVDDPRIDWNTYRADGVYGGEGISEGLRDYLLKTFKRVIGSYGASDLEINVGAESDITIALRKALIGNDELRDALIHPEYGVTPMIFQYNPLAYYIESNAKGELVVTICRPQNISPKIRYNIHDRGHVLRYGVLKRKLKKLGRLDILKDIKHKTDLPLLFLYGRSDMSIDYYGANVTPDSLREVLYGIPEIAAVLNTFRLISEEDSKHNKRMEIAVELVKDARKPAKHAADLCEEVCTSLAAINRDFYNARYKTATPDNLPELTFHEFGTGPFTGGQRKLKNEYVTTALKYDKL